MPTHATVADLGERAIIDRIRARVPAAPAWVTVGIGDDAAVVEPERNALAVFTTDALVEGVHFDLAFTPPDAVGHKALAVNLSDLAAMGATPRAALLSLAVPPGLAVQDLDAVVEGMLALAARHRTALIGGNVARSPGPLVVDVTAIGAVRRRRILMRAGARPGDGIFVSGWVGASAAGLSSCRMRAMRGTSDSPPGGSCEARFLRPEPRVRLGQLLGRTRAATACIDLSDGLAEGLRQLALASEIGVLIEAEMLPIDDDTRRWFSDRGEDAVAAACAGGEDYELLFTVSPRRLRALTAVLRLTGELPCTRIGVVKRDRALVVRRAGHDETLPEGYAHFR
jgi:thiamine-monophosphate kinase